MKKYTGFDTFGRIAAWFVWILGATYAVALAGRVEDTLETSLGRLALIAALTISTVALVNLTIPDKEDSR